MLCDFFLSHWSRDHMRSVEKTRESIWNTIKIMHNGHQKLEHSFVGSFEAVSILSRPRHLFHFSSLSHSLTSLQCMLSDRGARYHFYLPWLSGYGCYNTDEQRLGYTSFCRLWLPIFFLNGLRQRHSHFPTHVAHQKAKDLRREVKWSALADDDTLV